MQILSGITPVNLGKTYDISGDNKIGMEEAIFILQKVGGVRQ